MTAYFFWSDSAPQRLASIAAIALCAVCLLPHVRAAHSAQDAVRQASAPEDIDSSLFIASGGVVPDIGSPTDGAR